MGARGSGVDSLTVIELTLAAAMQLRALVRAAGVVGMPGVRVRTPGQGGPDAYELLIEDRPGPGDAVSETRGIRFYVDAPTSSSLGRAVLDLEGQDFVLRPLRDHEATPPA